MQAYIAVFVEAKSVIQVIYANTIIYAGNKLKFELVFN
jgi:hypothetical protein